MAGNCICGQVKKRLRALNLFLTGLLIAFPYVSVLLYLVVFVCNNDPLLLHYILNMKKWLEY